MQIKDQSQLVLDSINASHRTVWQLLQCKSHGSKSSPS